MAYQVGSLIGSTLLALMIMSLVRWIMGRLGYRSDVVRLAVPAAAFLLFAMILGGYGFAGADEGPQFLRALRRYAPGAVLGVLFFAFLDHRARKRHDGAGTDGTA